MGGGCYSRVVQSPQDNDVSLVLSPDHTLLGKLDHPPNPNRKGLLLAEFTDDRTNEAMRYAGTRANYGTVGVRPDFRSAAPLIPPHSPTAATENLASSNHFRAT